MGFIKNTKNFLLGEMDDRGYAWSMRNRADFVKGSQRKLGMYNDPTYLGFVFLFQPNSPLLNISNAPGSAYNYLTKIGEHTRAQYIKLLSEIIRDLNHNMPWYWQSIEGLENAYKYKNFKDPYQGGDDAVIAINTLESIDLKITQVVELYRNACFDMKNRREIVPENLRQFRLWIWVQELRKFQINQSLLGQAAAGAVNMPGLNPEAAGAFNSVLNKDSNATAAIVNQSSPWMLFQLDHCEFQTDESNQYLSSLSFAEAAQATNKLVIKYDNMEYENGLNFGDLAARLNTANEAGGGLVDKLKDKVKDVASNAAANIAGQLENAVVGAVEGFVTGLFLGNAHGFSISGALDAINQASVSSIVGNLSADEVQEEFGQPVGGNIHGPQLENIDDGVDLGNVN